MFKDWYGAGLFLWKNHCILVSEENVDHYHWDSERLQYSRQHNRQSGARLPNDSEERRATAAHRIVFLAPSIELNQSSSLAGQWIWTWIKDFVSQCVIRQQLCTLVYLLHCQPHRLRPAEGSGIKAAVSHTFHTCTHARLWIRFFFIWTLKKPEMLVCICHLLTRSLWFYIFHHYFIFIWFPVSYFCNLVIVQEKFIHHPAALHLNYMNNTHGLQ